MPTTRRQTAIAEGKIHPKDEHKAKEKHSGASSKAETHAHAKEEDEGPKGGGEGGDHAGMKRGPYEPEEDLESHPTTKKPKTEKDEESKTSRYQSGTIERGHIYFFYRPKVQLEEAHSIDDVRNFHMVLVPSPPEFATTTSTAHTSGVNKRDPSEEGDIEMKAVAPGADAVPAPVVGQSKKKPFRMITVGKKKLPDPDVSGPGGSRKKQTFWGTVTSVGDDLDSLDKGLGEKTYETKTRGTRHEESARLVARGGYAIVNTEAEMPSKRATHLGYRISHPSPSEFGDVQKSLGIEPACSFVLQVKNPLAPPTGPQQVHSKPAEYPDWMMHGIFGTGLGSEHQHKGRESYGLRFTSCETPELLDYKGAELLLIAARYGDEGLETSLGEGRGIALAEAEDKEAQDSTKKVFDELGLDLEKFPVGPLEGKWI